MAARVRWRFIGFLLLTSVLLIIINSFLLEITDLSQNLAYTVEIHRQRRKYSQVSSQKQQPISNKTEPIADKKQQQPLYESQLEEIQQSLSNETNPGVNHQHVISYAKIVIILAYMRSGSTFTGSIISKHRGSVYLFEPIRDIFEAFSPDYRSFNTTTILYPNGTSRRCEPTDAKRVIFQDVIHYLSCDFHKLSVLSLKDKVHTKRETPLLSNLRKVTFQKVMSGITNLTADNNWAKTEVQSREVCEKASLRVFKFIRMEMADVRRLVTFFPSLKIIHLNRDPRAMFSSRLHIVNLVQQKTDNVDVTIHCNKWLEDLKQGQMLQKEFPNSIRLVQYEDLANKPFDAFQDIFDFIGIPFTVAVKNQIRLLISSSREGASFDVNRKNSSLTALKWRSEVNFEWANSIYNECKKGCDILQYLPFETEAGLRNVNLPSRKQREKHVHETLYKTLTTIKPVTSIP